MSLFTRSFYGPDPSFTPLFRLLDDFDSYSREVQGTQEGARHRHHRVRAFNPKFDVRETENAYELHGELPGIERDNVHIEFTDPQTVVIRGRVERSYSAGTPPAGLVEGTQMSGAIAEAGESNASHNHRATVSDEAAEEEKEKGTPAETPEAPKEEEKPQAPADKYWVSERSIGEFSRTFSFPSRVDQDAVTAGLNNGVLNITIPKAKKHESRHIPIN